MVGLVPACALLFWTDVSTVGIRFYVIMNKVIITPGSLASNGFL